MPTKSEVNMNADLLEALARRAEAEANVFRALSGPTDPKEFASMVEDRGKLAGEHFRRAGETRPSGAQDPEGTPFPLSDRRGNYPENADVANQGGIGIFDSNSRILEEGEGTPNARLNPAIARGGDANLPNIEDVEVRDMEATEEDEEEAARERLRQSGFMAPGGDAPKRGPGRPPKGSK